MVTIKIMRSIQNKLMLDAYVDIEVAIKLLIPVV
jgi:hypothetical protein